MGGLNINVLRIVHLAQVPAQVGDLARSHEDVTILFMDIVGFTNMSKLIHPVQVMQFLFSIIDDLAELHGVQKVETAGEV